MITVRRTWCGEHGEIHYLDERGKCHGASLRDVESQGYSWPRHIGSGWYRLQEKAPPEPAPLEWGILSEPVEF